jgi:hypothetical protein
MPKEVMSILRRARVAGRPLEIAIFDGATPASSDFKSERPGASADHDSEPKKKSYSSKKRDRGDSSKGGKSDYAQRKNKERSKS